MKYFVNGQCIGCSLCSDICPEVFSMTSEGVAKATESEVSETVIETAEEAKESCPVTAIEEV